MKKKPEKKLNWKTTKEERRLIKQIAVRAQKIYEVETGKKWDLLTIDMDVTACHLNGCPLDLGGLLKADDFNFMHDVTGINRHIDRKTGKIEKFLPRFVHRPDEGPENKEAIKLIKERDASMGKRP